MTDRFSGGVVDCEVHALIAGLDDLLPYLDRAWSERLGTSEFRLPPPFPHPGLDVFAREIPRGTTPSDVSDSLREEVEAAVLIPPQAMVTSGWLNDSMALAYTSAVNDFVVDRWLPADPRFRFAIAVAPHDGELAAKEIRRLGSHPAAAGVCLSLLAINMGHRHYHPIYEAAEELGLPVIVHPGGFEGTTIGPAALGGVGPRTPEEVYTLLPQVAGTNVGSLVYDGVFVKFPRLKVVFAGFGFDWAVSVLWRADTEWRGLRVEVPWLTRPPSEYVADHVRFVVDGASITGSDDAWKLAAMLPETVLLWGSDAPYGGSDASAALARAPSELRERIASINARETFAPARV